MKKILIGLLVIGSISSFAQETKCEFKVIKKDNQFGRTVFNKYVDAKLNTLSDCVEGAKELVDGKPDVLRGSLPSLCIGCTADFTWTHKINFRFTDGEHKIEGVVKKQNHE